MSDATTTVVVGSGLSGLTAARLLAANAVGTKLAVLGKGGGVGGRLATRRAAGGLRFDHGAQYFTARDREFRAAVFRWIKAGVVAEWCENFPSPGRDAPKPPEPRYRGTFGMRAIAEHLAAGLPVEQGHRVTRLTPGGGRWLVATDLGESFPADAVLVTCPVPQSLALISDSGLTLDASGAHLSGLSAGRALLQETSTT